MTTYLFSIKTAILIFIVLAGSLTLPYAVYSYHKFGAFSLFRAIILYSFIFYLECAWLITILPLPDPAEVANKTGPVFQLLPFQFVLDFIKKSKFTLLLPSTWLPALKSSYVYVPGFNLCLMIPFGIYLRYYFKKNASKVILYTFLLSLFFEITQLTGLYGIYSRPYRLFDVDDLILNTLGGAVGYGMFLMIHKLLPSREKLDKIDAQRSVRVSYLRRLVAFSLDSVIVSAFGILFSAFFTWRRICGDAFALVIYCSVFSLFVHGTTIGKLLVNIRVEPKDWKKTFLRYILRNALIIILQAMSYMISTADGIWQFLTIMTQTIVFLFAVIDFLLSARHRKSLWYERISKTRLISTFHTETGLKRHADP